MTRIKICGLTNLADATAAQDHGAWALGFIFYPKSKRYITSADAANIIPALNAQCFGVFVNQTDEALQLAKTLPLAGLQLHGDETPDDCRKVRANFGGVFIKALRPKSKDDLAVIADYKGIVDYILLDAAADGHYGGSGQTADWALVQDAASYGVPVILAGGLTPDNITAAAKSGAYALDLSSGVEAAPGRKDHDKLKALFSAVEGATP